MAAAQCSPLGQGAALHFSLGLGSQPDTAEGRGLHMGAAPTHHTWLRNTGGPEGSPTNNRDGLVQRNKTRTEQINGVCGHTLTQPPSGREISLLQTPMALRGFVKVWKNRPQSATGRRAKGMEDQACCCLEVVHNFPHTE